MFPLNIESMQQNPSLILTNVIDTGNTTRVNYEDMYYYNVAVTNIVYPNKDISWRPKAVILVPSDRWQYGLCASSIVHFPINAPILFTERNYIPPIIINEIKRLGPTGEGVPAKVLIAGPVSTGVENYIRMLGFTTYRLTNSEDVYDSSADMGYFRLNVIPSESEEGREDIIVISGQNYAEGITAAFYAAHKGTPILLVQQNTIPQIIQSFIADNQNKNYYILGSERTVSRNVEMQINNLINGSVHRISGMDPYDISVNFSKYESPVDKFGWKRNKKDGWAFSFGELNKWYHIISGVLFAHLIKHTPLLITDSNHVPNIVSEYVINVNPHKPMPDMPPYMHAYILGSYFDIFHETQVEIEKVLDIEGKMAH